MHENMLNSQQIKLRRNVKVKVKHINNHQNHLFSHNFETGSRRNFWLVANYSLKKYISEWWSPF